MSENKKPHYKVDITPKSFAVVVAGAAIIAALWVLRDFVLLIIVAVIIASFVNAGARVLKKIKIPRVMGVILMYLLFFGIVAVMMFVFLPMLFQELSTLVHYLPSSSPWVKLLDQIAENGLSLKSLISSTGGISGIENFWKVYVTDSFVTGVTTIFHVIVDILLVFVISLFLSIQEGGVNSFLRAITPRKYEPYIIDLWNRVEHKIGYWFGGQFLLALLAGIIGFIGFTLMGVPYALIIALLLMFLEFIPFGLTVGTIVITPIMFATYGASIGVTVLIFMLVLNFFEANVFQPLIVHKTVGVPMLLVLISIVAGVQLLGWIGAIVGIPFAVLILEIIYDRERASIGTGTSSESNS